MEKTEPHEVWNPSHRSRRERMIDRLQVIGALMIAFGIVVAAAIALL